MKLTKGQMTILDMLEKGESVSVDSASCKPNGRFTLNAIQSLLQAGLIEITDHQLCIEYGLSESGKLVMASKPAIRASMIATETYKGYTVKEAAMALRNAGFKDVTEAANKQNKRTDLAAFEDPSGVGVHYCEFDYELLPEKVS